MEKMSDRLKQARQAAKFPSARGAAIRFGWKHSTYAAHENGQNEFDAEAAEIYGRAFKVSAAWLLLGEGQRERRATVKVMGRIGAGAEISPDMEQIPHDGLAEIEVPFPIPEDAQAFEVEGESMWPRYDPGDVVICWRFGTSPEEVIGWEAAVRTKDGRRFLKRVLRGARRGLFDLESFNAEPIRGVKLEWVGRVHAVVRHGQWRQITPRSAAAIARRIAAATK